MRSVDILLMMYVIWIDVCWDNWMTQSLKIPLIILDKWQASICTESSVQ